MLQLDQYLLAYLVLAIVSCVFGALRTYLLFRVLEDKHK